MFLCSCPNFLFFIRYSYWIPRNIKKYCFFFFFFLQYFAMSFTVSYLSPFQTCWLRSKKKKKNYNTDSRNYFLKYTQTYTEANLRRKRIRSELVNFRKKRTIFTIVSSELGRIEFLCFGRGNEEHDWFRSRRKLQTRQTYKRATENI